jgi:predicted phage-related endonuclease
MTEKPLFPWNSDELSGWWIVGMNHYRGDDGSRRLYVAMMRGGFCIKAEGGESAVWPELRRKALQMERIVAECSDTE